MFSGIAFAAGPLLRELGCLGLFLDQLNFDFSSVAHVQLVCILRYQLSCKQAQCDGVGSPHMEGVG